MLIIAFGLGNNSSWFPFREFSEELLKGEKIGSFFIRESTSNPGSFAMTLRLPKVMKKSGIGNILIQKTPEGNLAIPVSLR